MANSTEGQLILQQLSTWYDPKVTAGLGSFQRLGIGIERPWTSLPRQLFANIFLYT